MFIGPLDSINFLCALCHPHHGLQVDTALSNVARRRPLTSDCPRNKRWLGKWKHSDGSCSPVSMSPHALYLPSWRIRTKKIGKCERICFIKSQKNVRLQTGPYQLWETCECSRLKTKHRNLILSDPWCSQPKWEVLYVTLNFLPFTL